MKTSYLSREASDAVKGTALIFMVLQHFFTCPEWYVTGVSYPGLTPFVQYLFAPLKLCIPVFAFLTGYFYSFAAQKTYRYSLRKITDLLIPHWAVGLLMIGLALALGCWQFTPSGFVLEMMGLNETVATDHSVMKFSWYVMFYCAVMLVLPVLEKLSSGNLAGDVFLLLVLPVAAVVCVVGVLEDQFGISSVIVFSVLDSVREWLPCVVCGYLCGKYSLFERYFDALTEKFPKKWGKVLLWLCLCGIAFAGRLALPRFRLGAVHPAGNWRELVFTMDILYAPMFVYGLARLVESVKQSWLIKGLGAVGRKSLYIWFLHAVFFNVCREYTQPLVFFPRNPILVTLLGLTVCYALAAAIDWAVKPVLKWKNRYL